MIFRTYNMAQSCCSAFPGYSHKKLELIGAKGNLPVQSVLPPPGLTWVMCGWMLSGVEASWLASRLPAGTSTSRAPSLLTKRWAAVESVIFAGFIETFHG